MNHIKNKEGHSWCDVQLDNSFHFKDIEQVLVNNLHGERVVCQFCLRTLITDLLKVPSNVQSLTTRAQTGTISSDIVGEDIVHD